MTPSDISDGTALIVNREDGRDWASSSPGRSTVIDPAAGPRRFDTTVRAVGLPPDSSIIGASGE